VRPPGFFLAGKTGRKRASFRRKQQGESNVKAEILCVGTELLLGDIVNTNAADVARELAGLGINVYHHTVVGDNPERLRACLTAALSRSDIVVMTGGLGPTYDDLTKETAASMFGKKLVLHEESLQLLEKFFKGRGRVMTENNKKQAMMPEGCIVLPNPNGTAPGCIIEDNGKAAILMPGPPREMRPMLEGPVRSYLAGLSDGILVSRTVNFFGAGESFVEDRLKDLMRNSTNPTVAPYAKPAEVQVRVTARAATREEGLALIEPVVKQIFDAFPDNVYGMDYKNIEQATVDILTKNRHTMACAESCTGGLVGARIVENPGASAMYLGGVIAYSNKMKTALLGVSEKTLAEDGAVSRECALEMARGVRKASGADIGVAVTGIAGPSGGTDEKPVGLVFVAAVSESGEEVRELNLARRRADDREMIRFSSSSNVLDMAIRASRELAAASK
jgi:nicotinamide-nucleotide amidase